MSNQKILVVDDELPIRDMLTMALETAGYSIIQAESAQEAHAIIIDQKPDLVLLDWMMPGTSGLELLRRLKKNELTEKIPVVMLTAKTQEDETIIGLETGADDYIIKPFSPRELVSRVKAVLRRSEREDAIGPVELEGLYFDPIGHRVSIDNKIINLGPTEYRLLEFFLTHQERVYTRDQILNYVWGGNVYIDERTVDVHIRRLRKAISKNGHDKYVQTVRGSGYRFSTRLIEDV